VTADPDALNRQAVALQSQGESRQSLMLFRRAAEGFRAIGDRRGEGRCLNGVGALYKDLGEPQLAARYLEQALALRRETGDALGEAITLTTLGPIYQALGKTAQAHAGLVQALDITRRLGDRVREGQALFNLGDLAARTGQLESAQDLFHEALGVARPNSRLAENRFGTASKRFARRSPMAQTAWAGSPTICTESSSGQWSAALKASAISSSSPMTRCTCCRFRFC
jgi:tetratricopeptide (TPR) repeat protein